jgi:hypothetical protein
VGEYLTLYFLIKRGNQMACDCRKCPNLITVSSVTSSGGVTTITVPTGTSFIDGNCYCLGLFTTIPSGTNGSQINITDGTTTWTVFNRVANYWRPCCALKSRTLLKLKFFNDPSHFLKV